MKGWGLVLVVGVVLGVTSSWHARAGGAGTAGWVLPAVLLVALVAVAVLVAMSGERW